MSKYNLSPPTHLVSATVISIVVVLLLCIHCLCCYNCVCEVSVRSLFCFAVLYVLYVFFPIFSLGKREMVALLTLFSECHITVFRSLSLPRFAVGWSVLFYCGIYCSYLLTMVLYLSHLLSLLFVNKRIDSLACYIYFCIYLCVFVCLCSSLSHC